MRYARDGRGRQLGSVRRPALLIAAGLAFLTSCSPKKPSLTIAVDPPMMDNSCIGVVAWEVKISSASGSTTSITAHNGPVLAPEQCRLEAPVSSDEIDLDTNVSVTINGYDSARELLVTGTKGIASIRSGENTRIQLAKVGTLPTILVLHLDDLLGPITRAEVQKLTIEPFPKRNEGPYLEVTLTPAIEPYFAATEPGAFAIRLPPSTPPLLDGDQLTITFNEASSTPLANRLPVVNRGFYFEAQ
jgi:hypothetical protein